MRVAARERRQRQRVAAPSRRRRRAGRSPTAPARAARSSRGRATPCARRRPCPGRAGRTGAVAEEGAQERLVLVGVGERMHVLRRHRDVVEQRLAAPPGSSSADRRAAPGARRRRRRAGAPSPRAPRTPATRAACGRRAASSRRTGTPPAARRPQRPPRRTPRRPAGRRRPASGSTVTFTPRVRAPPRAPPRTPHPRRARRAPARAGSTASRIGRTTGCSVAHGPDACPTCTRSRRSITNSDSAQSHGDPLDVRPLAMLERDVDGPGASRSQPASRRASLTGPAHIDRVQPCQRSGGRRRVEERCDRLTPRARAAARPGR